MKSYVYQGNVLIVDADALFVPALEQEQGIEMPDKPRKPQMRRKRRRHRRKSGMTITEMVKKARTYKPRRVLGPEARETIRQEISNGMGLTECCKKYQISVGLYYSIKNETLSGGVKEEPT